MSSFNIRLDIVNKRQYEESEYYKEIKILIPKDSEELKKDFDYLGLDYSNLNIQDTHIKECEIICKDDPTFSTALSNELNRLIDRANDSGYTTPFNDMIEFYKITKEFCLDDKDKLLSILEAKREVISNIKDAIKFASNINCFELIEAYDNEELGRRLVYNGEIDIEDLMEYADLYRLGKEYSEDKRMIKTEQGYLMQECDLRYCIEEEEEFY